MSGFVRPPHSFAPILWQGCRIGLFGGSFDPVHQGHITIAEHARKQAHLDYIWWLPSLQNPLKNHYKHSFTIRQEQITQVLPNRYHLVSDLERQYETSYSYQILLRLKLHFSRTRFVWIMGADCWQELHKWHHWQKLMSLVPLLILERPTRTRLISQTKAAQYFRHQRIRPQSAAQLVNIPAPCWLWLPGKKISLSSSALRACLS